MSTDKSPLTPAVQIYVSNDALHDTCTSDIKQCSSLNRIVSLMQHVQKMVDTSAMIKLCSKYQLILQDLTLPPYFNVWLVVWVCLI